MASDRSLEKAKDALEDGLEAVDKAAHATADKVTRATRRAKDAASMPWTTAATRWKARCGAPRMPSASIPSRRWRWWRRWRICWDVCGAEPANDLRPQAEGFRSSINRAKLISSANPALSLRSALHQFLLIDP